MAIKFTNECVGCPEGMGCLGKACPYQDVPVVICDRCGDELADDEIYEVNGEILCGYCLKDRFKVSVESLLDDTRHKDEGDYEERLERGCL